MKLSAAMVLKAVYEDETMEILGKGTGEMTDSHGNSLKLKVTDENGNKVNTGEGLAKGSYTVTASLGKAAASYSIEAVDPVELFTTTLKTGTNTLAAEGVQYYRLEPAASGYFSECSLPVHRILYDSENLDDCLDYSYSADASWHLTAGETYYLILWFNPGAVQDETVPTMKLKDLADIEKVEVKKCCEELNFGETDYYRDLLLKITYSNGKTIEFDPANESSDEYGNSLRKEIYDDQGEEADEASLLMPGNYTVSLKLGDAAAVTYTLTVKAQEVLLLTSGSQTLTIGAGSSQIYQIPDGDTEKVRLQLTAEEGAKAPINWQAGPADDLDRYRQWYSDTNDALLFKRDLSGEVKTYLVIENLSAAEITFQAELFEVEDVKIEVEEASAPAVLPLGWDLNYYYSVYHNMDAVVTRAGSEQSMKLGSFPGDGYWLYMAYYKNGERVPADKVPEQEELTMQLELYWGSRWEDRGVLGEYPVTLKPADEMAKVIASGDGVVKEETAGYHMYSYLPETSGTYRLSFDQEVNYIYQDEENYDGWNNWRSNKETELELTEGVPFYLWLRTEEGQQVTIRISSHNWGEWKTDSEPGCTTDGRRIRHCLDAGCNETEEEVLPALGHSWSTEYEEDSAATCTQPGSKSIHCTVCGESRPGSDLVIPMLTHSYGKELTQEPTEEEDGKIYKVCSVCNQEEIIKILVKKKVQQQIAAAENMLKNDSAKTADIIAAVADIDNQALIDSGSTDILSKLEEQIVAAPVTGVGTITETTVDSEGDVSESVKVQGAAVSVAALLKDPNSDITVDESKKYSAQIAITGETTGNDDTTKKPYYTVDISMHLLADGEKIKDNIPLAAPVIMTIPVPELYRGADFDLYHIVNNQKVRIPYTWSTNDTITFATPSLSPYQLSLKACAPENHQWKEDETASFAATCTQDGMLVEKCEVCGETNSTVVPKGHTVVTDAAVAATCTATGLT
ncbi:MAG: hypothetical protein PHE06_07520, partial [Lachnospiraceae bacterium]|nr:hypothetical protein [Lachnospiraceae bacterium]